MAINTNVMTIDEKWKIDYQWNVNTLPMDNWDPIGWQLRSNRMAFKIDSDANWLPMQYQSTKNGQFITNGMWIDYQWTIEVQSDGNWDPIWLPIEIQSDGNWDPMGWHLRSNRMAIEIQSDGNWDPIGCQLITNAIPID